MESLRCPTCLGLLPDSGVARCPACHTRFRKGPRPISLGGHNGMSGRAHPLLEREFEARLEAKTAAGFRQRRRAARVSPRRIAALPPTLFESGGGLGDEPDRAASRRPDGDSIIIDLPDTAIHETTSRSRRLSRSPSTRAGCRVVEPAPVVEVVGPRRLSRLSSRFRMFHRSRRVGDRRLPSGKNASSTVFPCVRRRRGVTWPRQWKPVQPIAEVDAEPIDELAADSAN